MERSAVQLCQGLLQKEYIDILEAEIDNLKIEDFKRANQKNQDINERATARLDRGRAAVQCRRKQTLHNWCRGVQSVTKNSKEKRKGEKGT